MVDTNLINEGWRSMKAIYSHIRFIEECENEEQAKAFVSLWETMIQALSATHPVYIRIAPQYQSDRDFDSNCEKWQARVRISVGRASDHAPGVIKPRAHYDDSIDLIAPFGIPNAIR